MKNELTHEILVLIVYVQKPLLNANVHTGKFV